MSTRLFSDECPNRRVGEPTDPEAIHQPFADLPGFQLLPVTIAPRLGMALFIAAEAMFFAGLISAFLVFRAGNPNWPPANQPRLPIGVTGVNTLVLLLSAWFMRGALQAVWDGRKTSFRNRLGLTATFGAMFLVVQGTEWIRLVGFGLTLRSSIYGALFYTLIGIHALHVLGALIALLFVFSRSLANRYTAGSHLGVDLCRMYWNFVVGLWPILYVLIYLA